MILLTSATGTVGREIAALLKSQGVPFKAASRTPSEAGRKLGVEAVAWDWTRPQDFPTALAGVDTLFLGTPPGTTQEMEWGLSAVEAARKAGVRKIVKLSAINVENMPDSPHRRIELAVERGGFTWVFLRPGFFMQNLDEGLAEGIKATGTISVPTGEGRTSFIDARDIAAVAAVGLTGNRLDGRGLTLTGGEALTYAEVAAILSETAGYPIRHHDIAPAEHTEILVKAGIPRHYAEFLTMLYHEVVRNGYASAITPGVQEATGKAPRTLKGYARDYAAAFRR